MNERTEEELPVSTRQPAIDFFEQEAVRLEAQIAQLETAKKKGWEINFEQEANLPETRRQAASYREIAAGIADGNQEAIDQGYNTLENMHARLCEEISQAYQERQVKEQELASADDAPYQNAQVELQEIERQKEEAFRDKDWDQAITLSQEKMAKKAEMQQTPTGQLRQRIDLLKELLEVNSQEMGPISAAAKSLRAPTA